MNYDLKVRFSDAETSASETEDNATKPITHIKRDDAGAPAGAVTNAEGGAEPKYASRTYTETEIAQKLEGYLSIPRNLWSKIPKGAHVRYVRKDGAFKPGGFVTSYTIKDDGRKVIQLKNSFNANGATWPLDTSTIKSLYKKIHPNSFIEIEMIKQMLSTHNDEIRQLKDENTKIKKLLQTALKR